MSGARPKKIYGLKAGWNELSAWRKRLIALGGVAAAVVALGGAWAIAARVVEDQRPWAKRVIEVTVAGLQVEADQRTLRDLDDRLFKVRFEMQRNPNSQFLREELKRTQEQRDKLQRKIEIQIQRGEK